MNRSLRYVLLALLWSAVAGYLCFAGAVAVRGRAKRTVSRVEIEVVDSTSRGCLVSTMRAREWIGRSGIPTIGTAVDAVDLRGIERLIARNGFVKEAIASVDYSGTLRVSISQREPLLRLLTDGTNSYVTADGYVFAAPKASSLYVPVVTGDYRLPFPKDYVGSVHAYMQAELAKSEARIAALEKEKYPFFRQEIEIERRMKEVRRRRIRQGFFERATDFERRVAELREEKTVLRRKFRYEAAQVQERIDRLGRRQEEERERQKKLVENYEDFAKLLTFVESVRSDAFWRSEIVQIIARTTPGGALEVDLVPRSGRHVVRFGRLEQADRKFGKLMRFYEGGLSRIGWDRYRTIDIRYNEQVVCRK
ncbi:MULTISPECIES: hypothetical protein [Alistipes]|jgi:hypothetical protein|nr:MULTISPECIES: hypothetical protein [Alistipes]MCX4281686.1 hypothetical protein [Alistipes sp.]HUN13707.1 hypothetical protein [Alistipes sp.]